MQLRIMKLFLLIFSLLISDATSLEQEKIFRVRKVESETLSENNEANKLKINYCCQHGEVWSNSKCSKNSGNLTRNQVTSPMKTINSEKLDDKPHWSDYDVRFHNPCDHESFLLDPKDLLWDEETVKNLSDYCMANFLGPNGTFTGVAICLAKEPGIFVEMLLLLGRITLTILSFLSIPFLVATFLVYAWITELRNIRGIILMSYVACLCLADVGDVSNLYGMNILDHSNFLCMIVGVVTYFFNLARFFWLNVMCFDVWWTFRELCPLQSRGKQRTKLVIYSVYAWGCPSISTIICLIMEFKTGRAETLMKQYSMKGMCWLGSSTTRTFFLHYPAHVILMCNFFLFVSTVFRIFQQKKDIARNSGGNDSKRHDDNKHWFFLYLKLFIVMGINWSLYIIDWKQISYMPYVLTVSNAAQGVIIFTISVWNVKVKRLLKKKIATKNHSSFSRASTKTQTSIFSRSSISMAMESF